MKTRRPQFNGINLQDPVGKTVGRRRVVDAFEFGMKLQKAGGRLFQGLRKSNIPKGVYRFRTHEEADEWMIRMLAGKNR